MSKVAFFDSDTFMEECDSLFENDLVRLIFSDFSYVFLKYYWILTKNEIINKDENNYPIKLSILSALVYKNEYIDQLCDNFYYDRLLYHLSKRLIIAKKEYGIECLLKLKEIYDFSSLPPCSLNENIIFMLSIKNNIEINGTFSKKYDKLKKQTENYGQIITFTPVDKTKFSTSMVSFLQCYSLHTVADIYDFLEKKKNNCNYSDACDELHKYILNNGFSLTSNLKNEILDDKKIIPYSDFDYAKQELNESNKFEEDSLLLYNKIKNSGAKQKTKKINRV